MFLLASACGPGDGSDPTPPEVGEPTPPEVGEPTPPPVGDPEVDPAVPADGVPPDLDRAAPAAGNLPDLTIAAARLAPTTRWATFAPDSCEIQEACVDAPGTRRLLAFSTVVSNIGAADLVVGDPTGNPAFEFSPCHGHHHLQGFALYQLLDATGAVVLTGRKQGFCMVDSEPLPGTQGGPTYRDCLNQGLSLGWSDVYAANEFPCQWIDITELPAGTYQLRVTANADGALGEARLDNNVASTEVVIGPP